MVKRDVKRSRKRILQGFKGKPKRFFGFMRSLQTVKERVMALSTDSGGLTSSDQEAAELLGKHFADMFTLEAGGAVPSGEARDLGWDDSMVDRSREAVLA